MSYTSKIHAIKTIRDFTGMPLAEAKEITENLPRVFDPSEMRENRTLEQFADELLRGRAGGVVEKGITRNDSKAAAFDIARQILAFLR